MNSPKTILIIVFVICIGGGWPVCCQPLQISCDYCNPNWTPFKNMVSGLVGYNILKGDPIANVDPGYRKQIFLPTSKNGENAYELNNGITAKDLENCYNGMTKRSFTTTNGFRNYLEASSKIGYNLQVGVAVDVKVKGAKGSASATIPPAFTRSWGESSRYKQLKKIFTQEKGMVTAIKGICLMFELKLSTIHSPPFTFSFVESLKRLYKAKDSLSNQKNIFRWFIGEYGTHYMEEVQLGAQYIYETIYSSKVRNTFDLNTLQDCSYVKGAKVFGIQKENDKSKCTDSEEEKLQAMGSSNIRSQVFTKGSRPTDVKKWAVSDFTPVPLKFKLSPIVNLFTENNIDNKNLRCEGKIMKSIDIRRWFLPLYKDFCNTMMISCKEAHGCGIDDTCPTDAVCISDTGRQFCTEWSSWQCSCWNGLKQTRNRTCSGCKGTKQERDSNGRCYGFNKQCMFELPASFPTSYGNIDLCPKGQWAVGFTTRVEPYQGKGDDTAMNGIGLICGNKDVKRSKTITSAAATWGSWKKHWITCIQGFNAARLNVEDRTSEYELHLDDNTSTNSVQLRCNDGRDYEALNGAHWGTWKPWGKCPNGTKIIGIQTMVQPYQGSRDDTALNNVKFYCG